MRAFGAQSFKLLLPEPWREGGESSADERDGSAVFKQALLWEPPDGRAFEEEGLSCRSEEGEATNETDGAEGLLSQTPK